MSSPPWPLVWLLDSRFETDPNSRSWVAWTDEERLVGDAAKNQYASNPRRTVFDVKRMIGRKWEEKEVQNDIKHFPFKVVNKNGQPRVQVDVKG